MTTSTPIPWRRILAEGAVIVVSILLALGADAGWQARAEGREERALLSELCTVLLDDLETVQEAFDTMSIVAAAR